MNKKISVVIPTYNRLDNLKLVLTSLEIQEKSSRFDVIIADDGSTDGTRQYCENYGKFPHIFDLKYIWCGPNQGFRTSRTRNLGVAQAIDSDWVVLIDSDVMLNKDALYQHYELRKKHAGVVLIGMYHFSSPGNLTEEDVRHGNISKNVPQELSKGPPTPGLDCRIEGFSDDVDKIITEYDGLGFFGGNISWPVELWWKIGGMDEMMPSGMGEDAELGQRMRLVNIPVIQYKPIWGVHIHHQRDFEQSRKLVQASIAYIDRKYSIGTYAKITNPETDPREKNLSLWYTKIQGAKLVSVENDATVYAIDGTEKWKVGIPSPEWLDLLGFTWDDVQIIAQEKLDLYEHCGVIKK